MSKWIGRNTKNCQFRSYHKRQKPTIEEKTFILEVIEVINIRSNDIGLYYCEEIVNQAKIFTKLSIDLILYSMYVYGLLLYFK